MLLSDLARINAARAARRPVAVVTDLDGGAQRVLTGEQIASDGLAASLHDHLRRGKGGVVRDRGRDLFVSVHVPAPRLVMVGAVHISQALATMARLVGLDVTIVDPRTAFATAERFPDVRLLAEWPDDVARDLALDAYTAVALLTHDPKIDDQALVRALRADCFYIGALGSRKTQESRRERMLEAGFAETDLARIRGPIGLDIGAVSPAEIAVAILGEIIVSLRRGSASAGRAA